MNVRHDDPAAARQLKARIRSATRSSLTLLTGDANWVTRDEDDNPVREVLSDVWVRSKAIGEFRLAQRLGTLGMYVHIVRNENLKTRIKSRDLLLRVDGVDCRPETLVSGLERYLSGDRLVLELVRDREVLEVEIG